MADLLGKRLVVQFRQTPTEPQSHRSGHCLRMTIWFAASSPLMAPNQVWVADLTEHRTDEGKLYICAIKDLWSNRIVGWAIDSRMKARIVVAAPRDGRRSTRRRCGLHPAFGPR